MLNSETTNVIFGPPGTGKTTELIRAVGALLEGGTPPERICYCAFTRKASKEALERIVEATKLPPARFPFFKTLHALAFYQLGCDSASVMGVRDYLAICSMLGLSISVKQVAEDGTFSNYTKGDRLFFMENMARTMGVELKTYWESQPDEDIYYYELEQLAKTVANYKEKYDKRDFTDMLVSYVSSDNSPDVDYLFIDEAQDLSPLQWKLVTMLATNVKLTYIGGDDDQSIFRWAGADTDTFINLAGHRRVLHQSYRVPSEVQAIAEGIVGRIQHRVVKQWKARPAPGSVERINEIAEMDMSEGTWLLLARNAYLLEYYTLHCVQMGHVFDAPNSPIRSAAFSAIKTWEDLRKGVEVTAEDVANVAEMMAMRTGIRHGFKGKLKELPKNVKYSLDILRGAHGFLCDKRDPWDKALDRITDEEREYFLSALRRGEKFLDKPRIKIATIHSVKGGEAENVVLQVDVAIRTYQEFEKNPDDEWRVWYVGVTRAKERLIIMSPKSARYINI